MADEFVEILTLLSRQGEHRRYRTQLLSKLLDRFKSSFSGERAFLVSVPDSGGYLVWCSQGAGGVQVPDAAKCLSHHALMSALDSAKPTFFDDTHQDRRFRTAGEGESGNRVRWIRVFPLREPFSSAAVYVDSRFAQEDYEETLEAEQSGMLELLRLILMEEEIPALQSLKPREVVQPVVSNASSDDPVKHSTTEPMEFGSFVTRSTKLVSDLEELKKVASTDISVLMSGESGTGKELLARMIHKVSGRKGSFVTLHCGTVNEALAEVELFGHEKGAFTDAVSERSGILELANEGTLFLDAIEEAPAGLQAMLLGVLQTGRYRRVAGEEDREIDVRIVSAMGDRDPGDRVRTDLIYRLSGFRVHLPPLRERPEDILLILDHLLAKENKSSTISPETQALLFTQMWPGNGWQIRHLVQHMLAKGDMEIGEETLATVLDPANESSPEPARVGEMLGLAERELIIRALNEANGNKTEACRKLGISRRTLYRRIEKHGLLKDGESDPEV